MQVKNYNVGELVLCLLENKKDKPKPKWEGPFIIDEVLTGGAYRLRNASDNHLEPNPWNAARLRRFYAKVSPVSFSPFFLPSSFVFVFSFLYIPQDMFG